MEWSPGDRGNIEDRRGRSGGRAVPIGIGGVVVSIEFAPDVAHLDGQIARAS